MIRLGTFRSILSRLRSLTIISGNQNFTHRFHVENVSSAEIHTSFKYSRGGLPRLRGVVKEDELCHPTMLDANGEECIIVVKTPPESPSVAVAASNPSSRYTTTTAFASHPWRLRHTRTAVMMAPFLPPGIPGLSSLMARNASSASSLAMQA